MSRKVSLLSVLGAFLFLYCATFIVNLILGVGPNMVFKWLDAEPNIRVFAGSTFSYGLRLVAYILFPVLAVRKIRGINPWPGFFPAPGKLWKNMLYAFLLVSLVLTALFVIEVNNGWLVVNGWNWQALPPDAWLRTAWTAFLVNLVVAVGEETIFRGYLLTSLNAVIGRWPALIAMMGIFGLFHLITYVESGLESATLALGILLAALFGGLFGLVYLRTRSLWLPVVLHFTWNFMETDLLNLTGDLTNPNLVGALTRIQSPLSLNGVGWGNIVVLEGLVFAVIALAVLVWLRLERERNADNG